MVVAHPLAVVNNYHQQVVLGTYDIIDTSYTFVTYIVVTPRFVTSKPRSSVQLFAYIACPFFTHRGSCSKHAICNLIDASIIGSTGSARCCGTQHIPTASHHHIRKFKEFLDRMSGRKLLEYSNRTAISYDVMDSMVYGLQL